MGEDFGEASPRLPGEGRPIFGTATAPSTAEVIKEKKLTFEQASRCLNTLGKDESGSRYAYIMITATDLKLTDVSVILNFKHVLFLDLSGNYLTTDALQALTGMPFLIFLKAERNRVESASLKPMYYLQVLDLNQNQIKDVGNIDQPMLESLGMNYNDIYTTQFDTANLNNLKQLELRSNLLFEVSGVYPPNIEKLYMAANKITTINSPEFAKLAKLQILHLRENNLQNLDGFSESLASLKYINLRNNKITKFKEFRKLQCLPKLETLVVTGNLLPGTEVQQAGEGAGFPGEGGKIRDPVVLPLLVLLPNLKRINKTVVTVEDRIEAEDMENDILEALLIDDESGVQETDRDTDTTNRTSEYKPESELEL
jgi:hypothetical protein